jgi:hypothetical protein
MDCATLAHVTLSTWGQCVRKVAVMSDFSQTQRFFFIESYNLAYLGPCSSNHNLHVLEAVSFRENITLLTKIAPFVSGAARQGGTGHRLYPLHSYMHTTSPNAQNVLPHCLSTLGLFSSYRVVLLGYAGEQRKKHEEGGPNWYDDKNIRCPASCPQLHCIYHVL